ncbi:phosphocarrier protein [Brevinema andersonii]|uniref:Phosphocarrier protein HPr n=1 Tax=Brevinema andersonii TaxID=34097 RepID=A0A1I1DJG7_BREAD|nr:HPr family phosphocarrier protein [Brevinema andersonii]SFB75007.1 phosphocarrier protein [Brevinema andersonii]
MISEKITIVNNTGLHTRPGNELIKLIKSFPGISVQIEKGEKKINASSLLQVMSLGIKKDDVITITVTGVDESNENQVMNSLKEFFATLKD